MKSLAIATLLGGTVMLGACGTDGSRAVDALEARIAALERRQATAAPETADAATDRDVVDRLDADLRSLERRLADVEGDVASLRDAILAGDAGARPGSDARREQRSERRERMRSLTSAYRDKLAEVRRQYRDDPADPGRQRALREVVEWYRSERRAIMRDG